MLVGCSRFGRTAAAGERRRERAGPRHSGQSLARRAGRRRQQQPGFDNGIDTLRERFAGMGVRDITVSSASPGRGQLSTARNIEGGLRAGGGEACFVYMTSHGDESGFFLRPAAGMLSPAALDRALSQGCGERPTVLVVSACHSGTFINAAGAAAQPHHHRRRRDRPHELRLRRRQRLHLLRPVLPAAARRRLDLARARRSDALLRADARARLGVRRESRPQLFVGAAVANLRLPGR